MVQDGKVLSTTVEEGAVVNSKKINWINVNFLKFKAHTRIIFVQILDIPEGCCDLINYLWRLNRII